MQPSLRPGAETLSQVEQLFLGNDIGDPGITPSPQCLTRRYPARFRWLHKLICDEGLKALRQWLGGQLGLTLPSRRQTLARTVSRRWLIEANWVLKKRLLVQILVTNMRTCGVRKVEGFCLGICSQV